jgi:hypothetical protein
LRSFSEVRFSYPFEQSITRNVNALRNQGQKLTHLMFHMCGFEMREAFYRRCFSLNVKNSTACDRRPGAGWYWQLVPPHPFKEARLVHNHTKAGDVWLLSGPLIRDALWVTVPSPLISNRLGKAPYL